VEPFEYSKIAVISSPRKDRIHKQGVAIKMSRRAANMTIKVLKDNSALSMLKERQDNHAKGKVTFFIRNSTKSLKKIKKHQ